MAKEASKTSDQSADKAETKSVKAKSEAPKAAKSSGKAKSADKGKSTDKAKSSDKAKAAKSGSGRVMIVQTRSPIGRPAAQRQTLIGLKLNKIGRASSLEDTPAVRGMIAKVAHLVSIVEEGGSR